MTDNVMTDNHNRVHLTAWRWALIIFGGALIVAAFVWDFRNTANGGNPNPFNWLIFTAGEATAIGAFATSLRTEAHDTRKRR